MAIKKMSIDMFDKIAKESDEETTSKQERKDLSEEDAHELFNHAIGELGQITLIINAMVDALLSSCFGRMILETDEFSVFKDATQFYINSMMPNLLTGDIDSIIEDIKNLNSDDEDEVRMNLEELRVNIYEHLARKYL